MKNNLTISSFIPCDNKGDKKTAAENPLRLFLFIDQVLDSTIMVLSLGIVFCRVLKGTVSRMDAIQRYIRLAPG